MTKPDAGSLAGLLRDVLRSPTDRPTAADSPVSRAVRDVLRRPATDRAPAKKAAIHASPAVSRLKLARSLAEVRTNILAADDMTPMQKLRTTQLANELAARLRKLP